MTSRTSTFRGGKRARLYGAQGDSFPRLANDEDHHAYLDCYTARPWKRSKMLPTLRGPYTRDIERHNLDIKTNTQLRFSGVRVTWALAMRSHRVRLPADSSLLYSFLGFEFHSSDKADRNCWLTTWFHRRANSGIGENIRTSDGVDTNHCNFTNVNFYGGRCRGSRAEVVWLSEFEEVLGKFQPPLIGDA